MNHSLIFQILIAGLFVASIIGIGIYHEQVHVAINDNYNIESKVYYFGYKSFGDFSTVSDGQEFRDKCNDTCKELHSLNELVAYHLMPIYSFLGFCLLIVLSIYIDLSYLKYHYYKNKLENETERRYTENV